MVINFSRPIPADMNVKYVHFVDADNVVTTGNYSDSLSTANSRDKQIPLLT